MSRKNSNSISSIGMERLLEPGEADLPLQRNSECVRAVSMSPSKMERGN